jgi:hypothetical protein
MGKHYPYLKFCLCSLCLLLLNSQCSFVTPLKSELSDLSDQMVVYGIPHQLGVVLHLHFFKDA